MSIKDYSAMKKWFAISTAVVSIAVIFSGCGKLPSKESSVQSSAAEIAVNTRLSGIFSGEVEKHGDNSGFILLRDGTRAFEERVYLADMAEQTIDAQYYIWNSDKTGKLLMQKFLQAAERGISVRLLLDDFSVGDRNDQLLAIDSHPNIEVRINNPFIVRSGVGKWMNFIFDFDRLNRRMHNKTYSFDSTVAITGGRNIGDEYFDQNEHINFNDADLLSIGPVVRQVSESFIQYWNSPWAVPIRQLIEMESEEPADELISKFLAKDLAGALQLPILVSPENLENHFREIKHELVWAPATFLADEPGGTHGEAYSDEPKRVAMHLVNLAANSHYEILIESAYFVLNEEALQIMSDVKAKGVRVRALTNSMSSNDVLPNHASYAMVREDMLNHGIELHELRPDAFSCVELVGRKDFCDEDSHLSLHAKTAVFDRETAYVGSMNLNLRSAYLNTEAAMIVNSPILAEQLARQIELNMKQENSWAAVKQGSDVKWITVRDGRKEISTHEPMTSWLERVEASLLTLVPGAEYY